MPVSVTIQPVSGSELGFFTAWADVFVECGRAEFGDRDTTWLPAEYRAWHQVLAPDYEFVNLAALEGSDVVGAVEVRLGRRDNLHRADLSLAVRPEYRRRGIGTALLAECERIARDHGRTVVGIESEAVVGSFDPMEPFAARHGYQNASTGLRSDLDLPPAADLDALAQAAHPHASGYRLLTWWDELPQQWLADRVEFGKRMSTDPPLGELDYGEEHWDEARAQRMYDLANAQGRRLVETAALHEASGRLAGFTTLVTTAHDPTLAHQEDTLVLEEHRGHRLGLLMKIANLQALTAAKPELRRVSTYNAADNDAMLRVNRAMGFQPIARTIEWQATIADR